jgi:hypothetical protein
MRLLTPLLLTIALCPRAARTQDSPIYLNDNGGVPLESKGGKGKRPPSSDTAPWSYVETHIHYDKSIQHKHGEFFIDDTGYRAVCLDTSDGHHINIQPKTSWKLKSLSQGDSAEISSAGNSHIHIEPGPSMWYNSPNDMDDPDPSDIPHGTMNLLKAAKFKRTRPYPHVIGQSYIIHYCGPNPGCLGGDDGQTEQCPPPPHRKKQ